MIYFMNLNGSSYVTCLFAARKRVSNDDGDAARKRGTVGHHRGREGGTKGGRLWNENESACSFKKWVSAWWSVAAEAKVAACRNPVCGRLGSCGVTDKTYFLTYREREENWISGSL